MGGAMLRSNMRVTLHVFDTIAYNVDVEPFNVKIEIHGSRAHFDFDVVKQIVERKINESPNIETCALRITRAFMDAMRNHEQTMFRYVKCWITCKYAHGQHVVFVERFSSQWD